MPRQSARAHEEPISEDMLANIPVVGAGAEPQMTTFAIESEEPLAMPPAGGALEGTPPPMPDATLHAPGAIGAQLSQQLRYDLGEALARELDRASETFAASIADLENRLAQAEKALMSTHDELNRERDARELAEKRLSAFKELALK